MSWLRILYFVFFLKAQADQPEETPTEYRRRYDYKQSIKPPILINKLVPGYDLNEGARASDKFIRLSSSIPGSKGSLWSQEPNQFAEWEVEYSFAVVGRGEHGKDGLAFWYSQERSESGPVLGNRDAWTGLAIFHDTYDKIANVVSPYILGINNDGTKEVANVTNILTRMFGGCYRNFRNREAPVHVKVSYVANVLKVAVDDVQNGELFVPCFESHEIQLPTGYYFGFSASSSYPADDHDLIKVSVYEVNPPAGEHDLDREYEREHLVDGKVVASEKEQKDYEAIRSQFKDWFGESDYKTDSAEASKKDESQKIQDKIVKKIEEINKMLDGSSTNQDTSTTSSDVAKDLSDLSHKVEVLTQALTDTQTQITKVQSLVHTIHQTEETDLESISSQIDSLSNKIEELLHHGNSERHLVKSKLDGVATSLWHLLLMGVVGGVCVVGLVFYRARNQRATKKYM